jgi:hypothetical protein
MSDCFGEKSFAKLFTSVLNRGLSWTKYLEIDKDYKPEMEILNLELYDFIQAFME